MPIRTNLKDLTPSRIRLSREITLLSGGYSCPQALPGGRIKVYPWDADVDAWAAERAMRGTKNFMWDLLARVCDLNGCPISKFVVGDVSTVLLVSRALSHNNQVAFGAKCPSCQYTQSASLVVPDQLERVGEKSPGYPGYDQITLPGCQDVVNIRPLLVGDLTFIEDRGEDQRQRYPDRLCRVLVPVVDVNSGVPDSLDELVAWYHALDPVDKKFLADQEDALYPHLETDLSWKCEQCAHEFKFALVFDEKFFRPDGGRKPGRPLEDHGQAGVPGNQPSH